jgi:8-oxo-dGDP phosphatase
VSDAEPEGATWFETTRVREVYSGFSTVRIESVRTPDGDEVDREIVVHDDAAAVVPITDDGEVLLLRQYRQSVRRYLLEIPAGKLDVPGEDALATARRELAEEIGFEAGELEHLTTFQNSAGWTTEVTHVYLGRSLTAVSRPDGFHPKAEELDMEIVPMPLGSAAEAARDGTITDAKTVVGLLLAAARHPG